MPTQQSLFTLWMETSFIDNKSWLIENYLPRLNPTVAKVKGFVNDQTGVWDFSVADMIASRVPCEISYRPYSVHENDYHKQYAPKQFVSMVKSKLQGRKYRVNVGCEPSPNAADLPAVLKWTTQIMEGGDTQGVEFDVLSIPVQYLLMFTNDPRDIGRGMWDDFLRVAGFLRDKMRVVYHMYTGLVLPAGTFNDDYLRKIATEPELLRDPSTWATYEQITNPHAGLQRYVTRHIGRHWWLNYRALEKGYQQHDYFIGEAGWDWFGGEWDLQDTWARANGIAGSDLDVCPPNDRRVSGIRTLPNFTRWKFPQWDFKTAIVKQLEWYGKLLAHDPRCKGWAFYAYTFKEGDQQPYNIGVFKDILEGMIGVNMVTAQSTPVEIPPTPPPPSDALTQLYETLQKQPTGYILTASDLRTMIGETLKQRRQIADLEAWQKTKTGDGK